MWVGPFIVFAVFFLIESKVLHVLLPAYLASDYILCSTKMKWLTAACQGRKRKYTVLLFSLHLLIFFLLFVFLNADNASREKQLNITTSRISSPWTIHVKKKPPKQVGPCTPEWMAEHLWDHPHGQVFRMALQVFQAPVKVCFPLLSSFWNQI